LQPGRFFTKRNVMIATAPACRALIERYLPLRDGIGTLQHNRYGQKWKQM
jgi:hypothetical protein